MYTMNFRSEGLQIGNVPTYIGWLSACATTRLYYPAFLSIVQSSRDSNGHTVPLGMEYWCGKQTDDTMGTSA